MAPKRDPRIDAYIAEAADWAKPILNHLRSLPTQAVPGATETIKWGSPFWEYKGLLCGMAVFRQHCNFVLVNDKDVPEIAALAARKDGFGSLGKITSLADLPADDELITAIRHIAAYNEAKKSTTKNAPSTKAGSAPLPVPDDLASALDQHAPSQVHWDGFSVAKRNEYITWFDEAKTESTRSKRIAQAVEWIGEGKSRNWKYNR